MIAVPNTEEVIMPKLTDSQLVILSAAAQRDGGTALPLPKSLKFKGAAVTRMLNGLRQQGLLEEKPAPIVGEARRVGAPARRRLASCMSTNAQISTKFRRMSRYGAIIRVRF